MSELAWQKIGHQVIGEFWDPVVLRDWEQENELAKKT